MLKTHLHARGRKIPCYIWGGIGPRMEICEISCTPIPMVPRFHQCNGYTKEQQRVWTAKKCIALVGSENPLTSSLLNNTPLPVGRYMIEIGKFRARKSPFYRVCTKAMVVSKGSCVYGELKNVLPSSVQKTHLPMRGHKVPRCILGGIAPRKEICETSCTPIPMIPRLHQNNGYIYGKLRVWRAQ